MVETPSRSRAERWAEAVTGFLPGAMFLAGGLQLAREPGMKAIGLGLAGLGAALLVATVADLWVTRLPAAPAWREEGEACRRFRLRPLYAPGDFLVGVLVMMIALFVWAFFRGHLPSVLWLLGRNLILLLPIYVGLRAIFWAITLKGETLHWRNFWGVPRELRLSEVTRLKVKATGRYRALYLQAPAGRPHFAVDWLRYPDEFLTAVTTLARFRPGGTRWAWLSRVTEWLPEDVQAGQAS